MKRKLLHIDLSEPKENEVVFEMGISVNPNDNEHLKNAIYCLLEQGEKDNKEFVKAFVSGVLHFALEKYSTEELFSLLQKDNTEQGKVLSFPFNQSKLKS